MRALLILLLLPFFAFGQFAGTYGEYSGPWRELRATKVRQNHAEIAWESVAGATDYNLRIQAFADTYGYIDPDSPPASGWTTLSEDCVNDTTTGGSSSPVMCITGATAVIYGLSNNTRYRVQVAAVNPTNTAFEEWSYMLPIRTGLFPDETTTYALTDFSAMSRGTEPAAGDFSWWDNYFGNRERRVSDRVRDGNNRRISNEYPKVQRTLRMSDGTEFYSPNDQPSGLADYVYRVDDGSYSRMDNMFWENHPDFYPQTPGDTVFYSSYPDQVSVYDASRYFKYTNGTRSTVYDASPRVGYSGNDIFRSQENSRSWNGKYIGFETYAAGADDPYSDEALGVVYDLADGAVERTISPPSGFLIGSGQVDVDAKGKFLIFNNDRGSGVGAGIHVYEIADGSYEGNFEGSTAGGTGLNDYMGHADNGISIQGNAVVVGRKASKLIMIPLEGPKAGQEINLISQIAREPELGHITTQFYLHEGWALLNNHVASSPPSSSDEFSRFFNKIWAVQLDESAEDRGENAIVRFYGNLHTSGTKTTLPTNVVRIPYPNGNQDMTKVFANIWVGEAGSLNHSEAWVIERNTLHGDEIPLTSGGDVTGPSTTSVTVTVTDTTAELDWTWDEPATGQVSYGTTVGEGTLSTEETSYLNRHVQTLGTGVNLPALSPSTTYYYTIQGEDASANASSETQGSFTTDAAPGAQNSVKVHKIGSAAGSSGRGKIIVN